MISVCEKTKSLMPPESMEIIRKHTFSSPKEYSNLLDWSNESFWEDLPNPKHNSSTNKPIKSTNNIPSKTISIETVFGDLLKTNPNQNNQKIIAQEQFFNKKTQFLSEKYFNIWKTAVELKKDQKRQEEAKLNQTTKLDTFMKKLKKRRKSEKEGINIKEEKAKIRVVVKDVSSSVVKPCSSFKNRFDVQKSIIELQKSKLEEQNRIIQDLKLGIINDDLLKSIENTKINIREIFGSCSGKNKYKIPLILGEEPKFSITSQVAPKIVQKMEQRALERAKNREIILERKKLIEEKRERMLQEAIERKRVLEEEEKKRSLEIIKERRRKEMEMEKIRCMNKQKYMAKLNTAVEFYNRLLLKQTLLQLYSYMKDGRDKRFLAVDYYEKKILKESIVSWQQVVESAYKVKYEIADAHFEYKLLKRSIQCWQKVSFDDFF
uniref:Caldesmon-like n=1 Tax=Diabrotica virgifera virgifera TaxID=50390 RepID=A0A6P7FEG6_DIAVI